MRKSITQDMHDRQSFLKFAEKYGVSRASRKYNKFRSYVYFWLLAIPLGRHPRILRLPVPPSASSSQPGYRERTAPHSQYAPEKSKARHYGIVISAEKARLFPNR